MERSRDTFPAVVSEEIGDFLSDPTRLRSVAESIGTPFHVVFPEAISENIRAFRGVLSGAGIEGEVFYAAKANKSDTALEVAGKEQAGLDVSSLQEQRAGLSHGIPGDKIRLSGPEKDPRELALALQHGSSIAVDSPGELSSIIELARKTTPATAPRVLLRSAAVTPRPTRFGLTQAEMAEAYRLLQDDSVPLEGYTFHLDGYSLEERAVAAFSILEEMDRAAAEGLYPKVLDIGGGFGVSYVNRSTWEEFQRRSIDPSLFFKGRTFPSYYPYFSEHPKEQGLQRVLGTRSDEYQGTLAEELVRRSIQVHVEPGRSLLDQAGLTVFKVRSTKQASNGEWLVQVDGNMNHLSEQWFNTDFVPDPVLISKGTPLPQDFRASVAGNTCMENDIVTWRKVNFGTVPQQGDLLVYMNTAGYMMDSNETDFHRLPLPEKVAAFRGPSGAWKWKRDILFSHLDLNS